MNSPSLRPNGVSGSLVDGPMVKGSCFQLILGTPATQKLGVGEYSMALFGPFGAPRPDFFGPSGGRPKMMIFWHHTKKSKIRG